MTDKIKSEHQEQAEFVSWFRKNYPDVVIFAVPNGGQRNAPQSIKLKLEGVYPGVWDLFVPEWGLFIEFKKKSKYAKLTEHQKEFGKLMLKAGYDAILARGFDHAVDQILNGYDYGWCE